MTPERLYIVARDERELYEYLTRTVDPDRVRVILDRRRAERRFGLGAPPGLERRRRDRRRHDLTDALRKFGWALVDLSGPAAPMIGLAPGQRVVLYRFNPLVGRTLIGRHGVVLRVGRVRAAVQFAGESRPRMVDLTDLIRVEEPFVLR